jgi:distribution and morphology protein 12
LRVGELEQVSIGHHLLVVETEAKRQARIIRLDLQRLQASTSRSRNMSIEINWDTLTTGPDGDALAESIRAFIHDRFQNIALPRMIRSVKCHAFEFGNVAPKIELRDVCDPLPDFYENDADDSQQGDEDRRNNAATLRVDEKQHASMSRDEFHNPRLTHQHMATPMLSRAATPGILGGTSNLGYFHLPLSAGLSGTTTPLAAVAGAQFHNARQLAQSPESSYSDGETRHRSASFDSTTHSSPKSSSRPTSRHLEWSEHDHRTSTTSGNPVAEQQEPSPEDVQMVFHMSYCGNVKLRLTAEISLDYPMPSFVGIPLQLNITGLTFDGVGILAYIKKKAHFCFLCQEDAEALVGASLTGEHEEPSSAAQQGQPQAPRKLGALLEEIKVESEIGQREGGKQVLKNVGKVEKFVLEQVRRIFDDEFVYPSFWTFLL